MEATEKNYELRELRTDDLFVMFRIISKIGLKDFKNSLTPDNTKGIMKMFRQQTEGSTSITSDDVTDFVAMNIVMDVLEVVLSNMGNCKNDICELLSNLSGLKAKDIQSLPAVTFTDMVIDVIKKDEFKDFIKVASRLFK